MRALIPGILHLDGGYSQMIEKKEELGIAASKIEVYYNISHLNFFRCDAARRRALQCGQAVASQDGTCQPNRIVFF